MTAPDASGGIFDYERRLWAAGFDLVGGADEAGRGACAGPLVAAAVILDPTRISELDGLDDSKKLSAKKRERFYEVITRCARSWAVVEVSPGECDRLGIQEADLQGLRRALLRLDPEPDFALTDGFEVKGLPCPGLAVWKGDQVAGCVAAASIIAKTTRDRIMVGYESQYPGYEFGGHKGYCTKVHQRHLEELGPCEIHRLRYENVKSAARLVSP